MEKESKGWYLWPVPSVATSFFAILYVESMPKTLAFSLTM